MNEIKPNEQPNPAALSAMKAELEKKAAEKGNPKLPAQFEQMLAKNSIRVF